MNLVHFSKTNWVWFSSLILRSKMKMKRLYLLHVIPAISNHIIILLFILFVCLFFWGFFVILLSCIEFYFDLEGIAQPFQERTFRFPVALKKIGERFFQTECFLESLKLQWWVPVSEICLWFGFFELFSNSYVITINSSLKTRGGYKTQFL